MPKKKNGRSNLFSSLHKILQAASVAKKKNIPVQEYLESEKENFITRRKFLEQTGKGAIVTALAGTALLNESFKNKDASIVIVGAGIAGLSAAYALKKAGYNPKIYEASSRTGGRIFTADNLFFEGSWTELGGEFIDTSHKQMWKYIKEFDLETIDILNESELQLQPLAFYFNGRHYTEKEIIEAFMPIIDQIESDQKKLSSRVFYNNYNQFDEELDKLSLAEYLDKIGATSLIKNVIEIAYVTEYGEEIGNQSALNFLTVIGTDTDTFKYYGESDERYKIKGGNQKVTQQLTKRLQDNIELDHYLGAIKQDTTYKQIELQVIQSNGSSKTILADRAIITIPFTMLKDVELNMPVADNKSNCIKNLGYGKNAKLFAGFDKRIWRQQQYAGAVFTDNGFQCGWDNTQLQQNEKGGFTMFTGGKLSDELGTKDPADLVKNFLPLIDKIYPNASGTFNNITHRMYWPTYKYSKASYVSFKPGQYTTMSGLISEPIGNIYFAGEHCSYDFQGFMNGAATTGVEAAKKVLKSL
ncbi:MAG: FAD-dependent oxidoreductase [Fimbriimonadaceae bacterium]|nr:FAD-dependent oxidoreductase [Chitinophagales bacterium]